jgi:hypothetical protein
MNCKPGDRAVVVYSALFPEDVGKFVKVIELDGFYPLAEGGLGPYWLTHVSGGGEEIWADRSLRPIRPPAQEDETETVKEMESV